VVDRVERTVIDPTKNVLDLVEAERKHRDSLRAADMKFQDSMREAETRRINELSALKQIFDTEMAKVLRQNQDAATALLAPALKEVKNDLSDRTAKLEQFRYETSGKSSGIGASTGVVVQIITSLLAAATIVVAVVITRH
jgi:hypothetical protein